jgi:hypothetical protein
MKHLSRIVLNGFPIKLIPKDGVSDRFKMYANLVGAPRENLAQDKRPRGFLLNDPISGFGSSPGIDDRHLLALHRMAPDRSDDLACFGGKLSGAHSKVKLLNLASGKLAA